MLLLTLTYQTLLAADTTKVFKGTATYYHKSFEGRRTSNGEIFSNKKFTAAHKNLPFGTYVKVTNTKNEKSVVVKINDRLPSRSKTLIDLTKAAAKEIEMVRDGRVEVMLTVLDSLIPIDSIKLENILAEKRNTSEKKTNIKSKQKSKLNETKQVPAIDSLVAKNINTKSIFADTTDNITYLDTSLKELQPAGYGVQILSYGMINKALDEAKKVCTQMKEEVIIQPVEVKGKIYYRVIIGKYQEKELAKALKRKIKETYSDCILVSF